MRERMRKELSKAKAGEFDIKQDAGGVADIEFLAQYWALLWAKDYPPVAMFSDTIRQLESVASADLVPQLNGGRAHAMPIARIARARTTCPSNRVSRSSLILNSARSALRSPASGERRCQTEGSSPIKRPRLSAGPENARNHSGGLDPRLSGYCHAWHGRHSPNLQQKTLVELREPEHTDAV